MERALEVLHQLPDLAVLAIVVTSFTAITMAAPHFGRYILRLANDKARDDAAFDAYKAVMSMIGVVLAFSLVQVNGNLRNAEAVVTKEASMLGAVDRVLARSNLPELAAMRPLVAAYGQALVDDEWPLLARQERSPKADAAYTALSKLIRGYSPEGARQVALYNELLKFMDDLVELREEVLSQSEDALPSFFWKTIGALLLLACALVCLTDASLVRSVGAGAAAAAVALLLSFVIIIDRPFQGETSVSPAAIQKALAFSARRI